jgi:hypothetical protein
MRLVGPAELQALAQKSEPTAEVNIRPRIQTYLTLHCAVIYICFQTAITPARGGVVPASKFFRQVQRMGDQWPAFHPNN